MLLADAVRLFLESRAHIAAPATLKNNRIYLGELVKFLGHQTIETITTDDLRRWRTALFARDLKYSTGYRRQPQAGKLSVYTIHGMLQNARQFFNWLVDENKLSASPAKRLELPALPDTPAKGIEDDTLAALLTEAAHDAAPTRRLRNLALLWFMNDTGCRVGGVSTLKLETLALEKRRALVTEKGRGGGKTRMVFFTSNTQAALRAWLQVHPAFAYRRAVSESAGSQLEIEYVFVSERFPYPRLQERSIYSVLQRLRLKCRLQGRTNPHGFRHRRAKKLLEHGASLGLTSRILGHTDIRVTDRFYGKYAEGELQQGYDQHAE